MKHFEKWRREVNIILMNATGKSLVDLGEYGEQAAKIRFNDGEDPVTAAECIIDEVFPSREALEVLARGLVVEQKPKKSSKKQGATA
jgi:hypothetical protein